jgi:hypothetical protein
VLPALDPGDEWSPTVGDWMKYGLSNDPAIGKSWTATLQPGCCDICGKPATGSHRSGDAAIQFCEAHRKKATELFFGRAPKLEWTKDKNEHWFATAPDSGRAAVAMVWRQRWRPHKFADWCDRYAWRVGKGDSHVNGKEDIGRLAAQGQAEQLYLNMRAAGKDVLLRIPIAGEQDDKP